MSRKKYKTKYAKVDCSRVEDLQSKGLSPLGQLVMFELVCGRLRKKVSTNSGLYFPFTPEIIANNIGIKEKDAVKALKEIEGYGVAFYDKISKSIWVPDTWVSDYVSNDSHAQGIAREIISLPDNPFWERMVETFELLNAEAVSGIDEEARRKRQAWYSTIQQSLRERIEKRDTSLETCPNTSLKSLKSHNSPNPEHKGRTSKPRAIVFDYFFKKYQILVGKEHRGIAPNEKERIESDLLSIAVELFPQGEEGRITELIDQFFQDWEAGEIRGEDPAIWLFTTPEIWRMRAYKLNLLDSEDVFDKNGMLAF